MTNLKTSNSFSTSKLVNCYYTIHNSVNPRVDSDSTIEALGGDAEYFKNEVAKYPSFIIQIKPNEFTISTVKLPNKMARDEVEALIGFFENLANTPYLSFFTMNNTPGKESGQIYTSEYKTNIFIK